MDTQAVQRDIVSIFKSFVNPPVLLFVIAFDFERLRIYQDIFFDGGMGAIIFEFPCSVGELCSWGKDFDDEAWGLDRLHSSPVPWVARYRYVGMEVARLRNVHLHVGTINATAAPAQEIPEDSLHI